MIPGLLVVVPCGGRKIWSVRPAAGPTPAQDAYISSYFKVNRGFAEHFAEHWLILSAKYGFIAPDFMIPGPYEITFKHPGSGSIPSDRLLAQARDMGLRAWKRILAIGGAEYLERIRNAFAALGIRVCCPFQGLSMGRSMSAAKRAVEEDRLPECRDHHQEATPCR